VSRPVDEIVLVENWVHDQLRRAGFDEYDATAAIDEDLDWRVLARLRESGCPSDLAMAIVR
jgi:hypothetical protein